MPRTLCMPVTVTTMTATDFGWSSPRVAVAASEEPDQEEEEEGAGDLQPGGASTGSW